jgi:adenosylcobinamide-phosphate synthase
VVGRTQRYIIVSVSFFAILFAFVLEQARPTPFRGLLHRWSGWWVRACLRNLDAGQPSHGWLFWACAALLPALLAWLVDLGLRSLLGWPGHVLAFAWHVAILYMMLGFRQFSHHFTAIRQALDAGDIDAANQLFAQWRGQTNAAPLTQQALLHALMRHATRAAHHHVFGMLIAYVCLAALDLGPAGAVLYFLSHFTYRLLSDHSSIGASVADSAAPDSALPGSTLAAAAPASLRCATQAWHAVDYMPARLTALAFAVVGNFEEVMDAWRSATQGQEVLGNESLVLIAMGSALSLPESPQLEHLRSLVGLVWRTVVLLLLLIALLTLARLLG